VLGGLGGCWEGLACELTEAQQHQRSASTLPAVLLAVSQHLVLHGSKRSFQRSSHLKERPTVRHCCRVLATAMVAAQLQMRMQPFQRADNEVKPQVPLSDC
jgi:arginyl-tRNA--protein-N-Asp/Glu arginylyltransferase